MSEQPIKNINKISLAFGSGLAIIALIGLPLLTPSGRELLKPLTGFGGSSGQSSQETPGNGQSAVLPLVSLPPQERASQLEQIASSYGKSLDRSRARYLLASDFIKQYEGGKALRLLEGLEGEYPVLAPQILLKRGRAYELTNEKDKAKETWQELLKTYPGSPAVAEALYLLGRSEPQYWDRAIAQFPHHPLTHDILRQRLKGNPHQPKLLLLLAKYDPDGGGVAQVRELLANKYASQLTPQDWQAIALGYWEQAEYKKAAQAYAKSPRTPLNAYRTARGLHLSAQTAAAKKAYQQLARQFPKAEETGLGLRRLASLSGAKEALGYLNLVTSKFPDEAPDALIEKAKVLETLGNKKAAAQARQFLLNKYAKSDAAAKYRWTVAQRLAEAGDLVGAWRWGQPIATNNPDSDIAPKSVFWIGKWAQQLSRQDDAKAAFEYVLARYPQSYYAWRSAVLLGWNVGDFTSVRQMAPTLNEPATRFVPPAGSDSFKELYLLGQDGDARNLFEAELGKRQELTVAQQFTEGLLRLRQGKNLQGIDLIASLRDREDPQDRQEWKVLRQTPQYWYSLFPFPYYQTILNWSQQRQLNPVLVTSLIRQESRFEPEIRSPVGATGLMQVMPDTAKWIAAKIDLKDYSLTNPDDNVKLGTWYLDHTYAEYDNNSLLAVASYNAGPGNVANWMKKYSFDDPDVFVENIPFAETKGYVESVFANYWNYLRLYDPEVSQLLARHTGGKLTAYNP